VDRARVLISASGTIAEDESAALDPEVIGVDVFKALHRSPEGACVWRGDAKIAHLRFSRIDATKRPMK
jgi:hypothetical protein